MVTLAGVAVFLGFGAGCVELAGVALEGAGFCCEQFLSVIVCVSPGAGCVHWMLLLLLFFGLVVVCDDGLVTDWLV